MQQKIVKIAGKINEAKRLPAIQVGKKIRLAEAALDDTVSLMSEMASRIELLEGMQDGEID
ncbi:MULTISPECIES: hypothetical protein [unclassified Pseudoalteromonas]|uniref:hypothetical protein n=1 Tax=unclassified Pseudoalteromonas TaxID=194690 RepID=UPI001F42EE5B|nr:MULTISPECIES: hypothetical protein [unclassified Pseudoalteromonas]MCF2826812.1 hypothetical protein [Pseudoalteromonas sp. OF5H-5]MCF2834511.1 hypothetical protein [Pseudoalteromonas sp. DL2-H6]MCF2924059.1 hypothetical protein [Pseudoalteromonas sp. DL2-H1]